MLKSLLAALAILSSIMTRPAVAAEAFKVCADPLHPPYSTKEQTGFENKIAALFAEQLNQPLEYTWLPDRIGFIRNTLKAENDNGEGFKCDVIMGLPVGNDFAATTIPYYRSNYVLLIANGRGWDGIQSPDQLAQLPIAKRSQLKIAMFDRGPGTEWLHKQDLLEQGIPYQSMTGDNDHNIAMQIEQDLRKGKIDMVILWGPMAAYVESQSPKNSYTTLALTSTPEIRFDFAIAMGVRQGDKQRKQQLNDLINRNKDSIEAILHSYNLPLLPLGDSNNATNK